MGKNFFSRLTMVILAFLILECDRGVSENKGILVSTDWLAERLYDPDLLVLHAGTPEGYDSLHIPGSRLIIPGEFTLSRNGVRNELPPPDSVVNILRKAGVNKDQRMVLCYENERLISRTSRVYLTLVYAGLAEKTYVLNGGLPGWLEEGRESTDAVTDINTGNVQAGTPEDVLIMASELEKERWSPQLVIIDARSEEEYRGTPASEDQEAEGGHVEGAYLLPYQTSFEEDKSYRFKSDRELEKLLAGSGMKRNVTSAVYCGSGIRASVNYLVARHLGYPVLLYDGSYEEWSSLNLPLTGPVDAPGQN